MFFSLVPGYALPKILLLCRKNATLVTATFLSCPSPSFDASFPSRGLATASTFNYLAPSTSFWAELACLLQLGEGERQPQL